MLRDITLFKIDLDKIFSTHLVSPYEYCTRSQSLIIDRLFWIVLSQGKLFGF